MCEWCNKPLHEGKKYHWACYVEMKQLNAQTKAQLKAWFKEYDFLPELGG